MSEFRVCDKCKGFDYKELVGKLKEIDNDSNILVGCQSMCAIGNKMPFVIVNGIPLTANSIDELIDKVKKVI